MQQDLLSFPIANTTSLFNSSGKIQAGTFGLLGLQNNNMGMIQNSEPQKPRKTNSQRPQGHNQNLDFPQQAQISRNGSVGSGGQNKKHNTEQIQNMQMRPGTAPQQQFAPQFNQPMNRRPISPATNKLLYQSNLAGGSSHQKNRPKKMQGGSGTRTGGALNSGG